MVPTISIYTTAGVRPDNEDTVYPLTGAAQSDVFIVADGLGGHQDGKAASQLACDTIASILTTQDPTYFTINSHGKSEEEIYKDFLTGAVRQAAAMVKQRADQVGSDMSTTALVALLHAQTVYLAHVGDCALFRCQKGQPPQKLTREQRMGKRLTQVLGPQDGMRVSPQVLSFPFDAYSALVMGSDGFWESLDAAHIGQILETCPPQKAAESIGRAALDANSLDNVSVIVVIGEAFYSERPLQKPASQEDKEPAFHPEAVIMNTEKTVDRLSGAELVPQEAKTSQGAYQREIDELMEVNEEFLAQNDRLNKELSSREKELFLRETEVSERDQEQSLKETELLRKDQELLLRETELLNRDSDLSLRETELLKRNQELSHQETDLANTAKELSIRETELANKDQELSSQQTALLNEKQELNLRETELANREQVLLTREKELSEKQIELSNKEKDLQSVQTPDKNERRFTEIITQAFFAVCRKYPKIFAEVLTADNVNIYYKYAMDNGILKAPKAAANNPDGPEKLQS